MQELRFIMISAKACVAAYLVSVVLTLLYPVVVVSTLATVLMWACYELMYAADYNVSERLRFSSNRIEAFNDLESISKWYHSIVLGLSAIVIAMWVMEDNPLFVLFALLSVQFFFCYVLYRKSIHSFNMLTDERRKLESYL